MSLDPEMELWRKEWSTTNDSPAALLPDEVVAAAVRHQRRSHLTLVANIAFAIVLLVGSLMTAKRMHSREIVLWAVCVWMTTLIATYFSLEGWRRLRITTMESVADYARFHRKRAIADQWRVRTGVILLCVQATIACAWLTTDLLRARIHLLRFGIAMAVLLVVSLLWVYVFRRVWRQAAAVLETDVTEDDGN
jgi:hypothetical protein